MVRKQSSSSRKAEPPRVDDLKLINGIGPGVEKRLNSTGIYTYSQLAALSPADIAASLASLTGLSTERIIKQDWIGQARKLALETSVSILSQEEQETQKEAEINPNSTATSTPANQMPPPAPATREDVPLSPTPPATKTQEEVAPFGRQYHTAMFTIELTLDANNTILSTEITHIQSRRKQAWQGLQNEKLIDFLGQTIEAKLPSVELPSSKPEAPEPALLANIPSRLAGKVHLRSLKIAGNETSGTSRTIDEDTTIKGHLTLDLSELIIPEAIPLNYKAAIYGKRRGSSSGIVVGEAQGTIIPQETITIPIEGNILPQGNYRLAASVILALAGTELTAKPGLIDTVEGGLLQVV